MPETLSKWIKMLLSLMQGELVKSTQYKKLAPNALRFTYLNSKSCKPHEKTKQKHVICKISNFNM